MGSFVEDINHPLLFLIFLLLGLWGLAAMLTFVFKRLGWNGPAAFVQHP